MKFDRTKPTATKQTVMLQARTMGRVISTQKISWEVCKTTALKFSSSVSTIWRVYTLKQSSEGQINNSIVSYSSFKEMLRVEECESCPVRNYRILNFDNTPYNGSVVQLDSNFNIIVSTFLPFRGMPLWLEAYYPPNSDCAFIGSQKIKLDLEVCGTENITVVN
jgi:hypothetical protein